MPEPIEETLLQLRIAMETHRRSLAAEDEAPLPAAPEIARPSATAQLDGNLAEIGVELERLAGVNVTGPVAAKLQRLFASSDEAALAAWIGRVRRPGPLHPDLQLLIESLTTHETYFFRDRAQLDLLRTEMLPPIIAAARASGRRTLRIWSAGCATGEEAYSLAIVALSALLDAKEAILGSGRISALPGWTIEVLGTDISGRAIDAATAGIYATGSLSSFRDTPPEVLAYFPEHAPETRQVCAELRRVVRFQRFNLMERAPPIADCDVVACRNVLIYLTQGAMHHVQSLLHRALKPGGCLLLGRTDSLAEPALYDSRWSGRGLIHRRVAA